MQAPEFEDDVLGRLRRTRLVDGCRDEYMGTLTVGADAAELTLYSDERRDYTPTVNHARQLVARLPAVLEAAGWYAAERHVTDYNGSWREEGSDPLSTEAFLKRLRLTDLMVHHAGQTTFWFDVGELFDGHFVEVRMNASGQFVSTDLLG